MQRHRHRYVGGQLALVLSLAGAGSLVALGCSTFSSATGAVGDAKGQLDQGKQTSDSAQQQGKQMADTKGGTAPGSGGAGGSGGNPDDPDSTSLGAVPIAGNQAARDSVDADKKDLVDWKVIDLQGKPGYATFQLNWENSNVELSMDIFNDESVNIASSPKRIGGQAGKKVLVQIDQPGKYYIRIGLMPAPKNEKGKPDPTYGTTTVYTFKVKWNGPTGMPVAAGGGQSAPPPQQQAAPPPPPPQQQVPNPAAPPPQQQAQVPNPAGPPAATGTAPPAAGQAPPAGGQQAGAGAGMPASQGPPPPPYNGPPLPAATDPNHPRGRILSSYRDEDGQLVLYIDRGSSSNLKPGLKGQVLFGNDGDVPLDGTEFKITKIIDETKSMAKIPKRGRQSLGAKNNRCIIHLVPWP